jgi:hypothetical protein
MIAADQTYAHQLEDRDHAQRELMSLTVSLGRLSPKREQDVRHATLSVLLPVLRAADYLVAVGAELEALDGRINRHVRTHLICRRGRDCVVYQQLQRDWARVQRRYDAAYRALVRHAR